MARKVNVLISLFAVVLWLMGFFKWYVMLGIIVLVHLFVTDELFEDEVPRGHCDHERRPTGHI